jgi:hypothetical protein
MTNTRLALPHRAAAPRLPALRAKPTAPRLVCRLFKKDAPPPVAPPPTSFWDDPRTWFAAVAAVLSVYSAAAMVSSSIAVLQTNVSVLQTDRARSDDALKAEIKEGLARSDARRDATLARLEAKLDTKIDKSDLSIAMLQMEVARLQRAQVGEGVVGRAGSLRDWQGQGRWQRRAGPLVLTPVAALTTSPLLLLQGAP